MFENPELIVAKILQFADENEAMPITDVLRQAEADGCYVDNIAAVCGGENGRPYEVQFDYSPGNVSYWSTHEEARAEAARLWLSDQASRVEDHIARAVDARISKRVEEHEKRKAACVERPQTEDTPPNRVHCTDDDVWDSAPTFAQGDCKVWLFDDNGYVVRD